MRTAENIGGGAEVGVRNPEQRKLLKHQEKLVGYYLSGGDFDYVFNAEGVQDEIDGKDVANRTEVFKKMRDDGQWCERLERRLLLKIARSSKAETPGEIFRGMEQNKHEKRILATMTGLDWDDYNATGGEDVDIFMRKYPTPTDFEKDGRRFLEMIGEHNSEKKLREYVGAMDEFCQKIYGKKYEYYQAMKGLHNEANEWGESAEVRLRNRNLGGKTLATHNFERKVGNLLKDAGVATFNKGELIGNRQRKNEDAAYYNPRDGLFAVFDGAGGVEGAAQASGMALNVLSRMSKEKMPETTMDLKRVAEKISDMISRDGRAGITTGVFGKIVEDEDGKRLAYVSVGDSRIYVVRGQKLKQLTRDEGEGRGIYNWLGRNSRGVREYGDFPLAAGDRIVFCSDGVTGDFEEDFIPDDEFVRIVRGAETAEAAANGLIERATKRDDRTAIVVEV